MPGDFIADGEDFFSCAIYASLGFAVPAAVGAKFAWQHRRPIVPVGDCAFEMTGMDFSTSLKHGYTTERLPHDGGFNNIHLGQDFSYALRRLGESLNLAKHCQGRIIRAAA